MPEYGDAKWAANAFTISMGYARASGAWGVNLTNNYAPVSNKQVQRSTRFNFGTTIHVLVRAF